MKAGRKIETRNRYGWFSKAELCEFLDITSHWFDTSIKPKVTQIDRSSPGHLFYGREVLEVWAMTRIKLKRTAKANSNGAPADDYELLDMARASPTLERLRMEKYKIARLERREMQKSLVSRQKVEDGLAKLSTIMRETGEQLKRIDPRCVMILNQAIEKFDKENILAKI